MKNSLIVAAILSIFANCAQAETQPTKEQELCFNRATLIDQTYRFYRQGMAESEAVSLQISEKTKPQTAAWIKKMVRSVYSDTRSMFVNVSYTTMQYEHSCNQNPQQYLN